MIENRAAKPLLTDLTETRQAFVAALDEIEPTLATAPGLVGEWSARELVAHMGFWCEHASRAVDLAALGRIDEFYEEAFDVDARNAEVAREAQRADYAAARRREESSHAALADRVSKLDPALLSVRVRFGPTLDAVVRENGPDHYREHTQHLRAWWAEGAGGEEDEDPEDPDDPDDELDDAIDPGTDYDDDER